MIVGFTGTSRGMSAEQKICVRGYLLGVATHDRENVELRHGDCVGADEQASEIAKKLDYFIFVHPPVNEYKRAFVEAGGAAPAKSYLERNHDIVDACDVLLACPGEFEEQLRSGTWATIRYARKIERPIRICFPDGTWTFFFLS